MSHTVIFSLGSNLGNRVENIKRGFTQLHLCGYHITRRSHIIETLPYGEEAQGPFLNAACIAVTDQSDPQKTLETTHRIEEEIGRKKTIHWGPRIIDIDILCWDQEIIHTISLTIPHQDMLNRDFVLIPLLEICPHYFHPVLKKDIIACWNIYKEKKS